MPPRPLLQQIEIAASVACGSDGFWRIMMERPTWTLTDIELQTNVRRDTVRDYVMKLLRGGYIERCGEAKGQGNSPAFVYRVSRPSRDAPRLRRDGTVLPETVQETLWRTIKMMRRFDIKTLTTNAVTAQRTIPVMTVKRYVGHLAACGVLKVVKPGGGRGKEAEYLLIRNLGGAAPRILRTHLVFDPNSNSVIGQSDVKEVA